MDGAYEEWQPTSPNKSPNRIVIPIQMRLINVSTIRPVSYRGKNQLKLPTSFQKITKRTVHYTEMEV